MFLVLWSEIIAKIAIFQPHSNYCNNHQNIKAFYLVPLSMYFLYEICLQNIENIQYKMYHLKCIVPRQFLGLAYILRLFQWPPMKNAATVEFCF